MACISSTLVCSRVSFKPVKSRSQTTRLVWNKVTFAGNQSGALCSLSSPHHLTLMTPLAFKSAFFLSLLGASITHATNLNCDKSRGHLALKVSRPVLLSFGMSPGLTHQLLWGLSQAYCPGRIIPKEIQLRLTNSRAPFPHLFKLHPVAVHRQRKRTKRTTRMRHRKRRCSDFHRGTPCTPAAQQACAWHSQREASRA